MNTETLYRMNNCKVEFLKDEYSLAEVVKMRIFGIYSTIWRKMNKTYMNGKKKPAHKVLKFTDKREPGSLRSKIFFKRKDLELFLEKNTPQRKYS